VRSFSVPAKNLAGRHCEHTCIWDELPAVAGHASASCSRRQQIRWRQL